jgi:preprotein translocase subunit SecD
MLYIDKWKIILTVMLCVLGVAYAVPNVLSEERQIWMQNTLPDWMPGKTVSLGLDLQGGSHILLEADTATVIAERMDGMVDAARKELAAAKIGYLDLTAKRSGISFRLRDLDQDRAAAYKIANGLAEDLDIQIAPDGTLNANMTEAGIRTLKTQIINQSIEIIRRRVDETGTKEPVIQRQGTDRIVLQMPGVDNPEEIKSRLRETAKMTFHLPDPDATPTSRPGPLSMRLPMKDSPGATMVVRKRIIISGEMLVNAQATFDEHQRPAVSFRFDSIGSKRFCDVTRENIGKPFAIVLDGNIISAPVIQSAICGGNGIITGSFTTSETTELALLLRSGALPAELKVIEERSVGPTLGSDSVESGKKATMYGFAVVCVLMVAFYGMFGLFANVALIFNVAFIFALLSLFQATLTLPGIAGIILTIGMAVDANVLIYERIREELRSGRSVLSAIDTGYKQAMSTIVDSNLTTLIVALILFSFGTGPVKGFAVAMSIGIVTSMFSAIMITRLIIILWLRKARPSSLVL